jgi:glutamate/tyrosine decarboxylase-like PLP-dependent enzyme
MGLRLPNLDPDDWEQFRSDSHRALDAIIDHIRDIRAGPVWQITPPAVRAQFERAMPRQGRDFAAVLADFQSLIEPFANGNLHPLFMGWVHGAGTPVGMIAEMLAAGLNGNCGGRDHIGLAVERQIALWAAEMFNFPSESSGLFVTGTSMANFLGVLLARDHCLGHSVRRSGLAGDGSELVAYTSCEAHGCIARAMDLAGIGTDNLHLIPTDRHGAMAVGPLEAAIASDRGRGRQPFLIVATAGSVNTGAFDNLSALAEIAQHNQVWLHVDGAFGALAVLSDQLRSRVVGIERAHSIAFDFHKWAHVPYDAGFLLTRDSRAQYETFASPAAYLTRLPRGLGAGDIWPCDLGPDLSRGFRALKAWFTLQVFGVERIAACMWENCRAAEYLGERLRACGLFDLSAPISLNIVCFSVKAAWPDAVNAEIVMELHTSGRAAPSITRLNQAMVIRAAIVNHRTSLADIDEFFEILLATTKMVLARLG